MRVEEYAEQDAVALAALVARGEVEPRAIADAAHAAIARVNPELNAVIGMTPGECERALGALDPKAPLAGAPFLLKDLGMAMAGVTVRMGSRFVSGLTYPGDDELARRCKAAGVVTIGRSNTPEFGCNLSTEPLLFGPTRNPWDPSLSPCGSSGGAAAAVASGMVPIAHANDGGGSIRAPASACGLVGLKTSRGRLPVAPAGETIVFGMVSEFVVTRSVRDSAHMLAALAAPDRGARYTLPEPADYRAAIARPGPRLRIALATGSGDFPATHPDCVAATERAARLCESLGHHVEPAGADVDIVEGIRLWMHFSAVFGARMVGMLEAAFGQGATPDRFERSVWGLVEMGRAMGVQAFLDGFDRMNAVTRALAALFERYDVWLTPTMLQPPPPLGVLNADDPDLGTEDTILRWGGWAGYLPLYNAAGMPGITLPLETDARGVPIGVHFGASIGREDTLFALAAELEQARPWAARRPGIRAGR